MDNLQKCPNCGWPVEPGDKFCRNCGKPFEERLSETPPSPPPGETRYQPESAGEPIPPSSGATPPPPPPSPVQIAGQQEGGPPPESKYVAWEDRAKIGFFEALWLTWKESVFNPDKFFSHLPFTGGMGAPLLYALIIGWFYTLVQTAYNWLFQNTLTSLISRYLDSEEAIIPWGIRGGADFLWLLVSPVFIIIGIFICSGIYHLIMMLFGWAKRDFEATLRAMTYCYGPLMFAIVPFCGSPIGAIWSLVLAIIGLKHMQQTTSGKATFAVLLPIIFCCCVAIVLAILFGAAIVAFIQSHSRDLYNY